jgi:DNA-binding NarL/FixJ family response regulator
MHQRFIGECLPKPATDVAKTSVGGAPNPCQNEGGGKLVILLVHERQLYRDCLANALCESSEEIDVIAISNARHINAGHSSATVCVLAVGPDLGPGGRFPADLSHLLATLPNTPIIVLADEVGETIEILGALNRGVRGYLQSNLGLGIVIDAIRSVSRGGIFVKGEPASPVTTAMTDSDPIICRVPPGYGSRALSARAKPAITRRESEVLKWLCQGKPNKIIAYELGLSQFTVKAYVKSIMRKLGATNRTELSFLARSFVKRPLSPDSGSEPFTATPAQRFPGKQPMSQESF